MVKMHKKKEKETEKKADRPMPPKVKTDDLRETLAIARKMEPEDIIKLKHIYFGYFCDQARGMINALPDPNTSIDRDKEFMKLIVELQPKMDKAFKGASVYGLAKLVKQLSKRIDQITDTEKALIEIKEALKIIGSFDTQEPPKA